MKVLLYFENAKLIKKSGIGRALEHQKRALDLNGIEWTTSRHDKYDIAHVNTYSPKSRKLVEKCIKSGIPVIVHGHSTKEDFANSFVFWKLLKPFIYKSIEKCYCLPDEIITPTDYSKRLIENYDFVKCPVVAISNGVDLAQYKNTTVTKSEEIELRRQFGIGENQKIVMGIGWMFERKGFHDFIKIGKMFPDVAFVWFGSKNKMLNTKKINKSIKKKTYNDKLPGYKPRDTIIKMLHIADCFLFPSYEETEGIVLLEAMACGCPVVIRNIGAFDYLTDGTNCLKAESNIGFKQQISRCLSEDMTELVNNAYQIVEDRDLKHIGEKLKAEYEKLLNNKKEEQN